MGFAGSGIFFYPGNYYTFHFGSCLSSGMDSGTFFINKDTIFLTSFMEDQADDYNEGHGQVVPQTGKKFLLEGNKIYYRENKSGFDNTIFWIKEGILLQEKDLLDSLGNGYVELFDRQHRRVTHGQFINFKLYIGKKFIYRDDTNENE